MNARELVKKATSIYKISPLDAEILLSLAAKTPREGILAHPEKPISKTLAAKYFRFIKRRAAGEPVAYISGQKEFYGLEFMVNKNVLIPRPETELLVEAAIERINNPTLMIPDVVIDVGTGSANIIISIIKNIPKKIRNKINFFASDICPLALSVSKANSKRHNVDKKIKFIRSDLLNYFLKRKLLENKNLMIIANLPYVSTQLYRKNFYNLKIEPRTSLISKKKGTAHYRRLINQMLKIPLSADQSLSVALEISPEQKEQISLFFRKKMPNCKVTSRRDLAGNWRVVEAETDADTGQK